MMAGKRNFVYFLAWTMLNVHGHRAMIVGPTNNLITRVHIGSPWRVTHNSALWQG